MFSPLFLRVKKAVYMPNVTIYYAALLTSLVETK